MDNCLCALILVLALFMIYVTRRDRARARHSGFYTESAIESPTRPYDVPYTGTEPRGKWGSAPWGATALAMLPTLCE
jgi:hypothetical protein